MTKKAVRFPQLVEMTADDDPVAPPTRGRLWYDFEIPDQFLGGLPRITNKVRWVREKFPRNKRVKIGRDSAWYEADIVAHLKTMKRAVA